MKRPLVGFAAVAVLVLSACSGGQGAVRYQPADKTAPAQPLRWTFDSDTVGGIPRGAVVFSGTWAVHAEADAPSPPNALCQTGVAQFPAISLSDAVYTDVVLSTRFKPISGREDQAAGLIFRVQDKDNYYILRANALENNVNIYKYAGGRRRDIKEAAAQVRPGRWQGLRVEIVSNRIRGFLDDRPVVEAMDDTYKAGKIGLWTKADSVTCFDDVEAKPPSP
jgi:hypothetical protein